MFDGEQDAFERRLEIIQQMPDGPEKEQAMQQLFMDYPGLTESFRDQRDKGFDMATQETAQGTLAGPASNPFTQYVGASPLTHIAQGAEKYMGHKQMREARENLDYLSKQKSQATQGLAGTLLQQKQSQMLRGDEQLTEEERRQLELMQRNGRFI